MPSLWLPGAAIVHADNDGGSMIGGNAYMTWHTFEVDSDDITAVRGAQVLNAQDTQVTFVVDPVDGDIAQMLPPTRASRGLANVSGGVQTNRAGWVHLQCEVIARAGKPFTKYWTPKGRAAILRVSAFAKSWGVPNVWPAGATLGSYGAKHRRIAPGPSGHYGHSQWRENTHWDPGAIDTSALLVPNAPGSALPNLHQPGKLLTVDGIFDAGTVKVFQAFLRVKRSGVWDKASKQAMQRWLKVTPDGVVGPITIRALNKRVGRPDLGATWTRNTTRALEGYLNRGLRAGSFHL